MGHPSYANSQFALSIAIQSNLRLAGPRRLAIQIRRQLALFEESASFNAIAGECDHVIDREWAANRMERFESLHIDQIDAAIGIAHEQPL